MALTQHRILLLNYYYCYYCYYYYYYYYYYFFHLHLEIGILRHIAVLNILFTPLKKNKPFLIIPKNSYQFTKHSF